MPVSKTAPKIEGLANPNPNNWGGMTSRAISIRAPENIEQGIDTIATTENPSIVVDWTRWEMVREILPMQYLEMPANDKVPLLNAHNRRSIEDVLGSASGFKIDGIDLLCKTFVSQTEPEVQQKIDEGHIDSVSIGYMTDPERTIEIPKKEAVTLGGIEYRNDYTDDMPLLVRLWWQPKELSLVPIGADQAAKFRSEIRSLPEKNMPTDKPEIIEKDQSALELRLAQAEANLKAIAEEREVEKAQIETERAENLKIQKRGQDILRYNDLKARAEGLRSDGKLTNAGFDALFNLKTDNADSVELLAQLSKADPIVAVLDHVEKYAVSVKFGSQLAKEPLTNPAVTPDEQKQEVEANEFLEKRGKVKNA